jgi:hypothetical protein
MLAFNSGQAMVDPKTLNMEKGFSETIVNRIVEAVLKKRQYSGAYLTLLAEKHRSTPRKQIEVSRTLHAGSWVLLGYGHRLGSDDVAISNRNNKNRNEAEIGKRKRAHEKSKKFYDHFKRVLTESSPD